MILPVYLLGTDVLREPTVEVSSDSRDFQAFIDDMIETMVRAAGIGLAAPQVGRHERMFVIDITPMAGELIENGVELPDQPMVFINPRIIDESEQEIEFEEGCLSIPEIHEEVVRPKTISVQYLDRSFTPCERRFSGIIARVIQHEYDHLEGILFVDLITPFRRRLLKRRLQEIVDGETETDYPVFAKGKGVLS